MAFKIKVKKGTSAPASGALDSGELGYNTSANIFYVGNGAGNAATEIITNSSTAQTKVGDFTTQGKLSGEYLALETLTGSSPTAGQLTYDSDTGTFRAGIYGDYVLDLGEKSVFFIENVSGSTIAKGAVVGFAGAAGDHLRGEAFTANSSANPNYIMGIADQSISNNGFGFVVHFGKVRGIDTSAYAPGTVLYASAATAGALTSTEPTAPNLKLPIGAVVSQNGSSGIIQVRIKTGEKLVTLHDVNISSPSSGQVLSYDGSKWANTTLSGFTDTYLSSASFNTSTGVLTLTKSDASTVTVDLDDRYVELAGDTMTGTLTAPTIKLTNDASDTSAHRITVFDSGTTSYGMMLWNSNGVSGDWSTMIYGPNQANRRISFGKVDSTFTNHAGVIEGAYFDLDNWNLLLKTGSLGIGTESPSDKLHIKEATSANTYVRVENSAGSAYFGVLSDANSVIYNGNTNKNLEFWTNDGSSTAERMTFTGAGNLGIGTTSPNKKLHVSGTSSTSENDTPVFIQHDFTGTHGYGLAISRDGNSTVSGLSLGVDSGLNGIIASNGTGYSLRLGAAQSSTFTETMRLTSDNLVGIGTTSPSAKLEVANAASGTTLVLGRVSGQASIAANAENGGYMIIDSKDNFLSLNHYVNKNIILGNGGGNVGIGTASPAEKLDVFGNAKVSGHLMSGGNLYLNDNNTPTDTDTYIYFGDDESDTAHYIRFGDANQTFYTSNTFSAGGNLLAAGDIVGNANLYLNYENSPAGTDAIIYFGDDASDTAHNFRFDNSEQGFSMSDNLAVTGDINITGTLYATAKSFLIDHPTKPGMKLKYGSLEGPENAVYIRGKLKGDNVIELPEYWTKLIDEETITVSLTPIGRNQRLFVKEIKDNKIYIQASRLKIENIECYYLVHAERKDISKLEVEM